VVTVERVVGWDDEFQEFFLGFSHHFGRVETRWQARKYLRALMAPLERRNGWTLAEQAGDATPDSMQALLCSPCFDRDAVRAALVEEIGEPDGVLVADETGFIKKGKGSAGVQRQYTGTTGKVDNCQVGVFLAYHTRRGRALIDRELYLPQSWTDDRDRCARAHVPGDVDFATKPEQAQSMLERAVQAKVPFSWFTADEAYGQNRKLREWCEERDISYVMATRRDHEVASGLHTTTRVDELIGKVRAGAWRRMSCGDGAHGPRVYRRPRTRLGWTSTRHADTTPGTPTSPSR
jgi:SRSO17 transposase